MIREERRKKRRIRSFLHGLLIFAIIIAAATLVVMKLFTVEKVVVEDNKLYDDKVIEEAVLNDDYSWNSLYVFLKYKFSGTKDIPFVDTMDIYLSNPHTINIKVYEKGMMGYIYIPAIKENAYFDKDGLVVETSKKEIENVPRIQGIKCEEVVLYDKLPIEKKQLKELLTLTQGLKRSKLVPETITYGVENEPIVSYGETRIIIGDTKELTKKLTRLVEIMPSIEGMKGDLHLEKWSESSTNIVFEKKNTKKKK